MENAAEINQILSSLKKPQSTNRLLQVLVALRKLVNVPNHKTNIEHIKRNNCIKILVSYTQYNANAKVVDLSLSILGNCCADKTLVKTYVNDLNILHNLLRVLEKYDKDSIKGRVFRILGNLCDGCEPLHIILKEPEIIKQVTDFLKIFEIKVCETEAEINPVATTVSTVSMALRFIKKLIVQKSFDKLDKDYNIVNLIGILLIKCSNLWKGSKHDRGFRTLVEEVLKIIQVISSATYKQYRVVFKLTSMEEGNALDSFQDIIKIDPLKISKIILKLASEIKNQSDLPIKQIITSLLSSIQVRPNSKLNKNHYINLDCINKLMDHVGFRCKLQDSNNATKLVILLSEFDTENDLSIQCSLLVCSIFHKCRYVYDIIKTQLENDMINIIINKIEAVTGKSSKKIIVMDHKFKGIKTNTDKEPKRMKIANDDDRFLNNFSYVNKVDRCASPSSGSDISSCGPFSPSTSNTLRYDDSDSDNYSPLCSENECEDDFKFTTPESESFMSDCEEKKIVYNQTQLDLRNNFLDSMNALIKVYCTMGYIDDRIGNPKLLTLLLNIALNKTLTGEKFDVVFSIIVLILQTKKFLIPLMHTDVIMQLIEVNDTPHEPLSCSHCEFVQSKAKEVIYEISMVAQSECVRGEIAYNLTRKKQDLVNQTLVLIIPYIFRKISILRELLTTSGGLDILMCLLKNKDNRQLQKKAIKSICTLATDGIKIKNPVMKKTMENRPTETLTGLYKLCSSCVNIVTFKLDDGTLVQADRNELSKKSDYFNALLSGQFMESNQSEIILRNVNPKSFYCLLELLTLNLKPNIMFIFNYELETILDIILLTDRFLLNDLNYSLVCHVEQLINVCNVPIFYKWSIESGTNILRVESVAYALVSKITYCERLELFYSLFKLGYFAELVADIELLINQFL